MRCISSALSTKKTARSQATPQNSILKFCRDWMEKRLLRGAGMRKKFSGSSQMLLRMWSVWKNFASMSCRMVFLESRSPYANHVFSINVGRL